MNILQRDAKQLLINIFQSHRLHGPLVSTVKEFANQYVQQKITRTAYIHGLVKYKRIHDRYLLVMKFYSDKVHLDQKDIIRLYGNQIDHFINTNMSLDELDKQFQQDKRKTMIAKLVEGMNKHQDFQFLPGSIQMYFGQYFHRFMMDSTYTLPFFLHDLETKHQNIIACVDQNFRTKMMNQV